RLKRARRRMNAGLAPKRAERGGDGRHQIAGPLQCPLRATLDDDASEASGSGFLTVLAKCPFELALGQRIEQVGRGRPIRVGIESHVQRLVEPKGEAATAR